MVKTPVNMRLDTELLVEFDRLDGTRTDKVEAAMRLYIQQSKVSKGKEEEIPRSGVEVGDEIKPEPDLIEVYKRTIELQEVQIKYLHERLAEGSQAQSELRKSLAYEQQAHREATQLALPPPSEEGRIQRWRFWKRIKAKKKT